MILFHPLSEQNVYKPTCWDNLKVSFSEKINVFHDLLIHMSLQNFNALFTRSETYFKKRFYSTSISPHWFSLHVHIIIKKLFLKSYVLVWNDMTVNKWWQFFHLPKTLMQTTVNPNITVQWGQKMRGWNGTLVLFGSDQTALQYLHSTSNKVG